MKSFAILTFSIVSAKISENQKQIVEGLKSSPLKATQGLWQVSMTAPADEELQKRFTQTVENTEQYLNENPEANAQVDEALQQAQISIESFGSAFEVDPSASES